MKPPIHSIMLSWSWSVSRESPTTTPLFISYWKDNGKRKEIFVFILLGLFFFTESQCKPTMLKAKGINYAVMLLYRIIAVYTVERDPF